MGHWNHRILEFRTEKDGKIIEIAREIHEVFYDDDGKPDGYGEGGATIFWTTDDKAITPWITISDMMNALQKPILLADGLTEVETSDD